MYKIRATEPTCNWECPRPICVVPPALSIGETTEPIRRNPRYVILLYRFGAPHLQNYDTASSHTCWYLGCFTSNMMIIMIMTTAWFSRNLDTVWWHAGKWSVCLGLIPWYWAQQLRLGGGITPVVDYLSFTSLDPLFGKKLQKYSIIYPVSADPGTVDGFQVIVDFLGLKGLLSWGAPT